MRLYQSLVLGLLASSTAACATTFTGSSKVEGGPHACYEKCRSNSMEMSNFVYVGEYSTACVCQVPKHAGGEESAASASGASAASAVAVITQMRAEQERQRRARQQ